MKRLNAWVGARVTAMLGTMACAYVFTAVACVSLPAAIRTHNTIVIVSWFAQTFVQLVALSILQYSNVQQSKSLGDLHDKHDAIHEHLGVTLTKENV